MDLSPQIKSQSQLTNKCKELNKINRKNRKDQTNSQNLLIKKAKGCKKN